MQPGYKGQAINTCTRLQQFEWGWTQMHTTIQSAKWGSSCMDSAMWLNTSQCQENAIQIGKQNGNEDWSNMRHAILSTYLYYKNNYALQLLS